MDATVSTDHGGTGAITSRGGAIPRQSACRGGGDCTAIWRTGCRSRHGVNAHGREARYAEGAELMLEYYKRREATADRFRMAGSTDDMG